MQQQNNQSWDKESLIRALRTGTEADLKNDDPLDIRVLRFFYRNYQRPHGVDQIANAVSGDYLEALGKATIVKNLPTLLEDLVEKSVLVRNELGDAVAYRTGPSWLEFASKIASGDHANTQGGWFGLEVDEWKALLSGKVEDAPKDYAEYIRLMILHLMSGSAGSWVFDQLRSAISIPVAGPEHRQLVGLTISEMVHEGVLICAQGKYTPWESACWYINPFFAAQVLDQDEFRPTFRPSLPAEREVETTHANIVELNIPVIRSNVAPADRTLFRLHAFGLFTQPELYAAYARINPSASHVVVTDVKGKHHHVPKETLMAVHEVVKQIWKGHAMNSAASMGLRSESERQPHSYPVFAEMADTALLDPRIRDLLEDAAHLGNKVTRVLSGQ